MTPIIRASVASYKRRKALIEMAIDFAKAFNSVNRVALFKALKTCGCDPSMIDVIVELYTEDYTEVYQDDTNIGRIEVQNGIRQGYTGSTQLCVMIVNLIIEAITAISLGYRDSNF